MGSIKHIKKGFNEGYTVAKYSAPFMVDFVKNINPGKSVYSRAVRAGIRYAEMSKKLQRLRDNRSLIDSKPKGHER